MKIHQAVELTGISAKMIRYYEEIGLIPKPLRTQSGYREYHAQDIARLKFIYQARQLGFSFDDIKTLLQLRQNEHRHSADVKILAQRHVDHLQQKILNMQHMVNELQFIISCCHGNEQPNCAILEKIEHAEHQTKI